MQIYKYAWAGFCSGLMVNLTIWILMETISKTVSTQARPLRPNVYSRANAIVFAPKFGLPHSQKLLRITKVKWTIVFAISEKHASVTISHKQQGPYSCRIIILMEHIKRAPRSFEVFLPGGGLCRRRQIPNWTLRMQACWPCIRNRIHPAIDYFVFSGAHPRSVNIRGLQQNMKLAFSPHPLHASALLFMSRCERMCVNALAQDGWGYREMCVCFGSGALWKKKTWLTGVHRCCIDALKTLYIFQKNEHVLSDVHAYFEMYIALHSGLHVNQSGLFLFRRAELAVRWLRKQVVVFPPLVQ